MNTQVIIIGNIVALIGSILMVLVGLIKTKRKMLLVQCVQFFAMAMGNLILGGVSGFYSDMLSIFRNLVSLKWQFTWKWKLFFIAVQVALTAYINKDGIYGWLPVFAAVIFTWFLDSENEVLLKALIILAQIMWMIYDIHILNFVSVTFDGLTFLSNGIGIVRVLHDRKAKQ